MARRPILPFRWHGHGVDVGVIIDAPAAPLFVASDVCKALAIRVPYTRDDFMGITTWEWPGSTVTLGDTVDENNRPIALYTATQVRDVAGDQITVTASAAVLDTVDAFIDFIDTTVATLTGDTLRMAEKMSVPEEPAQPELGAGRTFSIGRAAKMLTRDPAISIGMHALFDLLRELGWIRRQYDIWIPEATALQAEYLVRQHRPVKAKRIIYPQIRITHTGMAQLHTHLAGVAALNLEPLTALTLLESNS